MIPGYVQKRWLKWVVLSFAILLLTACGTNPGSQGKGAGTTSQLGQILYENQTEHIGNAASVNALVKALPVPEGMIQTQIALETREKPYRLIVYYQPKDPNGGETTIETALLRQNARLLFATIHNMDQVMICVEGSDAKDISWTMKREEATNGLSQDLTWYSETPERLDILHAQIIQIEQDAKDTVFSVS